MNQPPSRNPFTRAHLPSGSRVPQVGYLDPSGDLTENKHLDPDHVIDNDPAREAAGHDEQLEKALGVLLKKL